MLHFEKLFSLNDHLDQVEKANHKPKDDLKKKQIGDGMELQLVGEELPCKILISRKVVSPKSNQINTFIDLLLPLQHTRKILIRFKKNHTIIHSSLSSDSNLLAITSTLRTRRRSWPRTKTNSGKKQERNHTKTLFRGDKNQIQIDDQRTKKQQIFNTQIFHLPTLQSIPIRVTKPYIGIRRRIHFLNKKIMTNIIIFCL